MRWKDINTLTLSHVLLWILTAYTHQVYAGTRGDIDIPDLDPYNQPKPPSIPPETEPTTTTPTTTTSTTTKTTETTITSTTTTPSHITSSVSTALYQKEVEEDKTKPMSNFSKDIVSYNEHQDPPKQELATKSAVIAGQTDDKDPKLTYIVAGSVAGGVAVVGVAAAVLGVLSSQGKLAPTGFTPVETAV